ncbi:unnamed protein product, partial [Prorocentrum cordatum]
LAGPLGGGGRAGFPGVRRRRRRRGAAGVGEGARPQRGAGPHELCRRPEREVRAALGRGGGPRGILQVPARGGGGRARAGPPRPDSPRAGVRPRPPAGGALAARGTVAARPAGPLGQEPLPRRLLQQLSRPGGAHALSARRPRRPRGSGGRRRPHGPPLRRHQRPRPPAAAAAAAPAPAPQGEPTPPGQAGPLAAVVRARQARGARAAGRPPAAGRRGARPAQRGAPRAGRGSPGPAGGPAEPRAAAVPARAGLGARVARGAGVRGLAPRSRARPSLRSRRRAGQPARRRRSCRRPRWQRGPQGRRRSRRLRRRGCARSSPRARRGSGSSGARSAAP